MTNSFSNWREGYYRAGDGIKPDWKDWSDYDLTEQFIESSRYLRNLGPADRRHLRQHDPAQLDFHSNFVTFYERYRQSERAERAVRLEGIEAEKTATHLADAERARNRKPGDELTGADRIRARGASRA